MTAPPCARDPELWASDEPADHAFAKLGCGRCHRVQECLDDALSIAAKEPVNMRGTKTGNPTHRAPDGTWGGLLWRHGHIVDDTVPAPQKVT